MTISLAALLGIMVVLYCAVRLLLLLLRLRKLNRHIHDTGTPPTELPDVERFYGPRAARACAHLEHLIRQSDLERASRPASATRRQIEPERKR